MAKLAGAAHMIKSPNVPESMDISSRNLAAVKRKQEELARTKEARKKEIELKEKELCALKRSYIKDYGSYSATRNADDDELFPYLYHLFF